MRQRFIVHPKTGALIPRDEYRPEYAPALHIISDGMDPVRHPITGKMMDSKSQFRRVTRAHGCIEVGNSPLPKFEPVRLRAVREDLQRAIAQHS